MTPDEIEEFVNETLTMVVGELWAEVTATQDANRALHERLGSLERALIRVIAGQAADNNPGENLSHLPVEEIVAKLSS